MSESRKNDHIEMSFSSRPDHRQQMEAVTYEPLLSAHPKDHKALEQEFLGFSFAMPLWVSSMTGGAEKAKHINQNLAKACGEFKLGMGLGSCRPLLEGDERLADFDVKDLMGDAPLFANFGIAQLEKLIAADQLEKAFDVVKKLNVDGLVIHVNPLQEWAQEEGDRFQKAPIETIGHICDKTDVPLIVKEVGQGMGPQSLKALIDLPIKAIELAAFGGTNFSLLEQRRQQSDTTPAGESLSYVGHTAEEMIVFLNDLNKNEKNNKEIIISGGITDPVTGYLYQQQLKMPSIIGMASTILKYAMQDYDVLAQYLTDVRDTFSVAKAYLPQKS
ncbi:MAG: isopentenyl-diphosphate delta-isomerase [Pseudomonadota bacterium]